MDASGGMSLGTRVGRVVAFALNGLAVLWVLAAAVSIIADQPSTAALVVIGIQAVVALGIQAYVLMRIATGWLVLSNTRRVGLTLLGVVVAPFALAFGIVAAAIGVVILLVVAILRSSADRAGTTARSPNQSPAGDAAGTGTGWTGPLSRRTKCSMCVDGLLPCSPCGRTGYRYVDGVVVGQCPVCGGRGGVPCGNCSGNGYKY